LLDSFVIFMSPLPLIVILCVCLICGCTTAPHLGKPTAFNVREISQEFQRLRGTYIHIGRMRPMGMSGVLILFGNGTFEYIHPSCTRGISKTVGTWHPTGNRIQFESELIESGIIQSGSRHIIKWNASKVIQRDTSISVPWGAGGLRIVETEDSLLLYPLDPVLRKRINEGPAEWPLKKHSR
jgi:hypothetical protein